MNKSPEEYFQEQTFAPAPKSEGASFTEAELAFMRKYMGLDASDTLSKIGIATVGGAPAPALVKKAAAKAAKEAALESAPVAELTVEDLPEAAAQKEIDLTSAAPAPAPVEDLPYESAHKEDVKPAKSAKAAKAAAPAPEPVEELPEAAAQNEIGLTAAAPAPTPVEDLPGETAQKEDVKPAKAAKAAKAAKTPAPAPVPVTELPEEAAPKEAAKEAEDDAPDFVYVPEPVQPELEDDLAAASAAQAGVQDLSKAAQALVDAANALSLAASVISETDGNGFAPAAQAVAQSAALLKDAALAEGASVDVSVKEPASAKAQAAPAPAKAKAVPAPAAAPAPAASASDVAAFNETVSQQFEAIKLALDALKANSTDMTLADALYRSLVTVQNSSNYMGLADIKVYAERTAGIVDQGRKGGSDFGFLVDLLTQECGIIEDMVKGALQSLAAAAPAAEAAPAEATPAAAPAAKPADSSAAEAKAPSAPDALKGIRPVAAAEPDVHGEMSSEETLEAIMRNEPELQMVGFYLGSQEFTVPTMAVQEVIRYQTPAKLPSAPEFVAGVINLRGKMTPLVYLRDMLEVNKDRKTDDRFIIVCRRKGLQFGLIIERVHTMYRVPQRDIDWGIESHLGVNVDLISGLLKLNDNLVAIVSVDRVVDYVIEV